MSKLMGIPFGINLNISDMKKVGRFEKKIQILEYDASSISK